MRVPRPGPGNRRTASLRRVGTPFSSAIGDTTDQGTVYSARCARGRIVARVDQEQGKVLLSCASARSRRDREVGEERSRTLE